MAFITLTFLQILDSIPSKETTDWLPISLLISCLSLFSEFFVEVIFSTIFKLFYWLIFMYLAFCLPAYMSVYYVHVWCPQSKEEVRILWNCCHRWLWINIWVFLINHPITLIGVICICVCMSSLTHELKEKAAAIIYLIYLQTFKGSKICMTHCLPRSSSNRSIVIW